MAFAAAALPYLQYAGMAMSAYSSLKGGQANQAAYNAQGQVAENNAKLAEMQAVDAERRGRVAASNQGIRTNQLKGTQRATMAANGVDLSVGSAQEILNDTDYFGGIDRAAILDSAAREAWGYRTQGANYQTNAGLLRSRADGESPWMSAGTSLLTSAGKVASTWYGGGSAGASSFSSSPMSNLLYSNGSLGD